MSDQRRSCELCSGSGESETCRYGLHQGGCPCPSRLGRCPECDGAGGWYACAGCEERVGSVTHGLCRLCRESCPRCERGTAAEGRPCGWCRDTEVLDAQAHERMHGPEAAR